MTSDYKAGYTIGNYVLDSYIGGGGFGVVWLAHAAVGSSAVAIKILTSGLSEGDRIALRADIEVLAAAAASRSEHVVKVLGGGVDKAPYIVMEYVEGDDLSELLAREGKLSYRQTIDVGLGIADALRALGDAGIIHRDIKPANVMIDKNNVVKLADFGIAKIVGYETLTMTGQTAMTMAYAAPEVWDDSGRFGRPTTKLDLYALGVVLFQCLAGALPFVGNFGSLYRQHTEQPPNLRKLPDDVPPSLKLLIQRCLEKRQEDRPHDAAECLTILQRAEAELAQSSKQEPTHFGPWVKGEPHERQVWAWHCHHEVRGDRATVEVHFADSLDYASTLRKAVMANRALVPFGAERLIETSRLLLHPDETWYEPPNGRFDFWIARDDLEVEPATFVTEPAVRNAVTALAALIETSEREGLHLDFGSDLTLKPDGSIYLRRPGLSAPSAAASPALMAFLRGQSLYPGARALVDEATSFESLVALVNKPETDDSEATQIMPRRRNNDATVVRDADATVIGHPEEESDRTVVGRPPPSDATVIRPATSRPAPPPSVSPAVVPPRSVPASTPHEQPAARQTPAAPTPPPVVPRRIVQTPQVAQPAPSQSSPPRHAASSAAAPPARPPNQPPRTPPLRRGPPWWLVVGGGLASIGGIGAAAFFLLLGGDVHKLPGVSLVQGTPSIVIGTPVVEQLTPGTEASGGAATPGTRRPLPLVDALLFESDRDGHSEIYIMNADGADQRRLTNTPKPNSLPDASPDTNRVVFVSARDTVNGSELYEMRPDGAVQTHIPTVEGDKLEPNISPDGKRIVFEVKRGENYDVYAADIDGKNPVNLTNSPSADIDPVWSPDGKRIVFGSNRDGNMDIWVMNANGTGAHRLTNSPGFNSEADWSPDGKKIVFESDRRGNFDLYVMNEDGTGVVRLGDDPGDEYDPAWSPDGKLIAYTSRKGPTNEVFVINADGSGPPRDLSNNPANDGKPAWIKVRRAQ